MNTPVSESLMGGCGPSIVRIGTAPPLPHAARVKAAAIMVYRVSLRIVDQLGVGERCGVYSVAIDMPTGPQNEIGREEMVVGR